MWLLSYKPRKGVTRPAAGRQAADTNFSQLFAKGQAGATAPARNYTFSPKKFESVFIQKAISSKCAFEAVMC